MRKEVEEVLLLLAFHDPSDSPSSVLLSQTQRQIVASALNAALLKSSGGSSACELNNLIQELYWSQEQLAKNVDFPQLRMWNNEAEVINGNGALESKDSDESND